MEVEDLHKEWHNFLAQVGGENTDAQVVRILKMAFYAGASASFNLIGHFDSKLDDYLKEMMQ